MKTPGSWRNPPWIASSRWPLPRGDSSLPPVPRSIYRGSVLAQSGWGRPRRDGRMGAKMNLFEALHLESGSAPSLSVSRFLEGRNRHDNLLPSFPASCSSSVEQLVKRSGRKQRNSRMHLLSRQGCGPCRGIRTRS